MKYTFIKDKTMSDELEQNEKRALKFSKVLDKHAKNGVVGCKVTMDGDGEIHTGTYGKYFEEGDVFNMPSDKAMALAMRGFVGFTAPVKAKAD